MSYLCRVVSISRVLVHVLLVWFHILQLFVVGSYAARQSLWLSQCTAHDHAVLKAPCNRYSYLKINAKTVTAKEAVEAAAADAEAAKPLNSGKGVPGIETDIASDG